jgi:hypothetical protein
MGYTIGSPCDVSWDTPRNISRDIPWVIPGDIPWDISWNIACLTTFLQRAKAHFPMNDVRPSTDRHETLKRHIDSSQKSEQAVQH